MIIAAQWSFGSNNMTPYSLYSVKVSTEPTRMQNKLHFLKEKKKHF